MSNDMAMWLDLRHTPDTYAGTVGLSNDMALVAKANTYAAYIRRISIRIPVDYHIVEICEIYRRYGEI